MAGSSKKDIRISLQKIWVWYHWKGSNQGGLPKILFFWLFIIDFL